MQISSNYSVHIVQERQKKPNNQNTQKIHYFFVTLKHHYYFNFAHIKMYSLVIMLAEFLF